MGERPCCMLCGEPMPEGEEMFQFHGLSGPCPKPPMPKPAAAPVPDGERVAEYERLKLRLLEATLRANGVEWDGPINESETLLVSESASEAEAALDAFVFRLLPQPAASEVRYCTRCEERVGEAPPHPERMVLRYVCRWCDNSEPPAAQQDASEVVAAAIASLRTLRWSEEWQAEAAAVVLRTAAQQEHTCDSGDCGMDPCSEMPVHKEGRGRAAKTVRVPAAQQDALRAAAVSYGNAVRAMVAAVDAGQEVRADAGLGADVAAAKEALLRAALAEAEEDNLAPEDTDAR